MQSATQLLNATIIPHTQPSAEKSLTCFFHQEANGKGQSLLMMIEKKTPTQKPKMERDQEFGLWYFVCHSSFRMALNAFLIYMWIFYLCCPSVTLCSEMIWHSDDSSESVQCKKDCFFLIYLFIQTISEAADNAS